MSDLKTQENDADVATFLSTVENQTRRTDAQMVLKLMGEITGKPPKMWGTSIVGFGAYSYAQKSSKPARWMTTGFSPRKTSLTIYIMPGFADMADLLASLGPHKTSVSCLYITNLAKIDLAVLQEIIERSYETMTSRYDCE